LGAMGGFGLQYGVEGTEQIVSQHLQWLFLEQSQGFNISATK
jgi:hypothetical protein